MLRDQRIDGNNFNQLSPSSQASGRNRVDGHATVTLVFGVFPLGKPVLCARRWAHLAKRGIQDHTG